MNSNFFAHSANRAHRWHGLSEHLQSVADMARTFCSPFRQELAEEYALAGLLHDLGKYGDRFQARLHGQDSGLDHWSAGAQTALLSHQAVAAALAIEGHHVGLQPGNKNALRRLLPPSLSQRHPLNLTLTDENTPRLLERAGADGLNPARPENKTLTHCGQAVAAMLDVRILFSALVDADFLDTEAHFEGNEQGKCYRPEGPALDATAAIAALDAYMERLRAGSRADPKVRESRESLWTAAVAAGAKPLGRFTLTAPTGSGKTFAMLRFALEHARQHGLRRIVLAVPFLTVIEQTAREYRKVFASFPQHFILEHHSLAGLGAEKSGSDNETGDERQRRLLAENWDAPIVLTTNVQLLESLFSNRPGACRKLHNLTEAIILFDEAQSLPQHLAVPTLAALSHLSSAYRSSVVFATATQPAFDTLDERVKKDATQGWRPEEVVPGHPQLFENLKRVEVRWPAPGETLDWSIVADGLRSLDQVLCVVNLKRHAQALLKLLPDDGGAFHLSTNLCAGHRAAVLENVRARLKLAKPCRLISTQCVEAGVDLDFPCVYRAMAPLEAVAQAAGRCNREGRLSADSEVVVFDPVEDGDWRRRYPTHAYYQATAVTQTMLAQAGHLEINNPAIFRDYYRRLYDLNHPASQNADLNDAIQALDFPEVARRYRLIEQDAIQVLVPWGDNLPEFEALRAEAEDRGADGAWMRRAQTLAVSVYRPRVDHPAWGILIPAKLRRGGTSDEWFILEDPDGRHYDPTLGLVLPQSEQVFIA